MIIFDLDGTLSIVGDRVKYLNQKKKDWDAFYNACDEDVINEPIIQIFNDLKQYNYIKIVTGRRESVRNKTLLWLNQNNLIIDNHDLHMRKDGDFRHDTIVKPELIIDFQDHVTAIFEDRNSMVVKWRELGFTCLQVAEGNF